jgi:hypothetical protein
MNLSRRKFIASAATFIAAPAIIRVADIMPVKAWADDGVWLTSMEHPPPRTLWPGIRGWWAIEYEAIWPGG